jgi:hypothetical protein
MKPDTTQSAATAANAAIRLSNPADIEVAGHIGFRGAPAAGNPVFRKYGIYDTLVTGRTARRAAKRLLEKNAKRLTRAGGAK